jgi:hypothetical protein
MIRRLGLFISQLIPALCAAFVTSQQNDIGQDTKREQRDLN